jgi:hypothetical protein
MDSKRFDAIVRGVPDVLSRRNIVRTGAAGLVALATATVGFDGSVERVAAKKKKKKRRGLCPGQVTCPERFCCSTSTPVCCSLAAGGGCCPSTAPVCCTLPSGFSGCCA